MIDCTVCKKEIRSNNMTRHMRTHSKAPYKKDKQVEAKLDAVVNDKKRYKLFYDFSKPR